MQEWAAQFYSSKAWKDCRKIYAQSRRHLCERCLEKGIYKPGEIVHHKTYLTPGNINDTSVTLNPDNLLLVCRDCHAEIHAGHTTRYTCDELGRIITKPDTPL